MRMNRDIARIPITKPRQGGPVCHHGHGHNNTRVTRTLRIYYSCFIRRRRVDGYLWLHGFSAWIYRGNNRRNYPGVLFIIFVPLLILFVIFGVIFRIFAPDAPGVGTVDVAHGGKRMILCNYNVITIDMLIVE